MRRVGFLVTFLMIATAAAAQYPAGQYSGHDPLPPVAPTDDSQCYAHGFEWRKRTSELQQALSKCEQDMYYACNRQPRIEDQNACFESEKDPAWSLGGLNPDHSLYTRCTYLKRALRLAEAKQKAEVGACRSQVEAHKKANASKPGAAAGGSGGGGTGDAGCVDCGRSPDGGTARGGSGSGGGRAGPVILPPMPGGLFGGAISSPGAGDAGSSRDRAAAAESAAAAQRAELAARAAGTWRPPAGFDNGATGRLADAQPVGLVDPFANAGAATPGSLDPAALEAVARERGWDAIANMPAAILTLLRAQEYKIEVDEMFASMDRGPLTKLRVEWLHPDLSPPEPELTLPQAAVETLDFLDTRYGEASSFAATVTALNDFFRGGSPEARAQGYLDTMKSLPDTVSSARSLREAFSASPNPPVSNWQINSRFVVPIIAVNNAADALVGAMGESVNQFANSIEAYTTFGSEPFVADFNAVGLSTLRELPVLGRFIQGSEYIDHLWEQLRRRR